MLVELNTEAFNKAKDGDVFTIEVRNGKTYAKPIAKVKFLKNLSDRVEETENKIQSLETRSRETEKRIDEKLKKLAILVGGTGNEKK